MQNRSLSVQFANVCKIYMGIFLICIILGGNSSLGYCQEEYNLEILTHLEEYPTRYLLRWYLNISCDIGVTKEMYEKVKNEVCARSDMPAEVLSMLTKPYYSHNIEVFVSVMFKRSADVVTESKLLFEKDETSFTGKYACAIIIAINGERDKYDMMMTDMLYSYDENDIAMEKYVDALSILSCLSDQQLQELVTVDMINQIKSILYKTEIKSKHFVYSYVRSITSVLKKRIKGEPITKRKKSSKRGVVQKDGQPDSGEKADSKNEKTDSGMKRNRPMRKSCTEESERESPGKK